QLGGRNVLQSYGEFLNCANLFEDFFQNFSSASLSRAPAGVVPESECKVTPFIRTDQTFQTKNSKKFHEN
ncbi:MAG: hypothetical protein K2M72_09935, partial [Paramuribaculum sp.]|nr:hypothetical protein [Paramuribaculum sp.]